MNLDIKQAARHLGQTSEYKDQYDPSLLVAVDRRTNRELTGYVYNHESELPFIGLDLWNAYEVSALNKHGRPVSGVMKITYDALNAEIVESKSLKLYFNSFNNTLLPFEDTHRCVQEIERRVAADLSSLLNTDVSATMYRHTVDDVDPFARYLTLEDMVASNTEFKDYQENRDLIVAKGGVPPTRNGYVGKYHSALLKSNCKITHQPDWGDVYVYYEGDSYVEKEDLLKYIVSFRNENHFHEEITESIYFTLFNKLNPKKLLVVCRYTRRGGIDINVVRANDPDLIPAEYSDTKTYYQRTLRQ